MSKELGRFIKTKRAIAGATAASVLGFLGACAPEIQKPTTHASSNAEIFNPKGKPLPPIEGPWFEAYNPEITIAETPVASVQITDGKYTSKDVSGLPPAYREAFLKTIENPIVKLAAHKGTIAEINVYPSKRDNGHFDNETPSLSFEISNGKGTPENRVFFDTRAFEALGIHEATHALSEDWYRHLEYGTAPNDKILANKIDRVTKACRTIRDAQYHKFINENRNDVAKAFDETSNKFDKILKDPEAVNTYGSAEIKSYAHIMDVTAEAVKKDNKAIYAPLQYEGCQAATIFDIPYEVPGAAVLGEYTEFDQQLEPIKEVDSKELNADRKAFICINDGKALQQMINIERQIPVGHAFDNPNEATSSVISSLAIAPEYLATCLNQTTNPKQQAALEEVVKSILDITKYTNPEVIDYLSENPKAAAVIKKYS